jgi:nucleoside-diphosphate kinase
MAIERTLFIIKPDAMKRDLVGEILEGYIKPLGFKFADMKYVSERHHDLLEPLVALHYNKGDVWCQKYGARRRDALAPTWDSEIKGPLPSAIEFGYQIRAQLYKSMSVGPLLLIIFEGEDAIAKIRDIIGATDPIAAAVNTIRGDLREVHMHLELKVPNPSFDGETESIDFASRQNRAVHNLVHASDSAEEAVREIKIWFPELVS